MFGAFPSINSAALHSLLSDIGTKIKISELLDCAGISPGRQTNPVCACMFGLCLQFTDAVSSLAGTHLRQSKEYFNILQGVKNIC